MRFQSQHPNYEAYDETAFFYSQVPREFCSELEGFIIRYADNASKLKAVCHNLAARIPRSPTSNAGWDWLISDLSDLLVHLSKGKSHKLMDFLGDFVSNYSDTDGVEDLNDLLKVHKIGYQLRIDQFVGATWNIVEDIAPRVTGLEEAQEEIKGICEQALEHLDQAKEHLKQSKDDRDRKDAVRDVLSATEALLKQFTGCADIKDATSQLRSTKQWGPDVIVKDGLSVWNHIHNQYPDIRHGQSSTSDITDAEAIYWIDRLAAFLKYLARQKILIDKSSL